MHSESFWQHEYAENHTNKGEIQMPHISIKAIKGASPQQMQECAEQIRNVITKTLGKPEKYTSVSFDEYSFDSWESVYNEHIKDKDNVLIKPGYSVPKTFK
jgi:phenylpyruvate tautomerase PptA (4-oxalocrotonate tautomerase family)